MISKKNEEPRDQIDLTSMEIPEGWTHEDYHQLRLPALTGAYANYISSKLLDIPDGEVQEIFAGRSESVVVYSSGRMSRRVGVFEEEIGGYYDTALEAIVLSPEGVRDATTVPHELGHALCVNRNEDSITDDSEHIIEVASGLLTLHHLGYDAGDSTEIASRHGEWINEAVIEDTRDKAFRGPDKVSYAKEVLLLRAIQEVIPGIEEELLRATFITGHKAKVWGMIEDKFGPLWLDFAADELNIEREAELRGVEPEKLDHDPIRTIVEAIPDKEIREKFRDFVIRNDSLVSSV